MKTALTIAGSDPTGGAGLQADLKVFKHFGLHGISVVSSITAQNTEGVDFVFPIDKRIFEKQIHVLLSDIKPNALKTGMLYSTYVAEICADCIEEYSLQNLVIDPVTVSSSGAMLVENATLDIVREKLFPHAAVITPNLYEASVLTGIAIDNRKSMEEAAKALKDMGPVVVVITGGHLDELALDLYYDGEFHSLEGKKIEGKYHGTGCTFSAAVTALLALGSPPLESVRRAKEFIYNSIKLSFHPGSGMGLLNI